MAHNESEAVPGAVTEPIHAHPISHPSSVAFLTPDMFAELAHRAFRICVLDAHLLAHLRRPVEEVFQVCDAGVRRLSLHEVVNGFAHGGTAVDAALDLCRQQPRCVAENFGGEGLRGGERFRNWAAGFAVRFFRVRGVSD